MARARGYKIGEIPADQKFRGQAALILATMSKDAAKTTAAIAAEIKPQLITRQDPERVVAFYMSVWKKKGWVRLEEVEVPDAEAAASNTANDAPHSVNEEVGGVPADTQQAATMEVAVEEAHALPDLKGKKLSDGVLEVLKFRGVPLTASGITQTLNKAGYEFKENQVRSALQNLLTREAITKVGDEYSVAA